MLKSPITNKQDLDEAAKIARRQQYEDERKKRIFNAKERLFGVDVRGLRSQIEEKEMQKRMEEERERCYNKQAELQQQIVYNKMRDEEKSKRKIVADLNNFRWHMQRPEQSRDYDINDPNSIKKSLPARIGDNDPRLGVSSAQIFSGEDLCSEERRKVQREQQRAWLDQQIQERKVAEFERRKAENEFDKSLLNRENYLDQISKEQHNSKNRIFHSIAEYNKFLSERRKNAALQAKQEEYEDDLAEIYNMLTSDMLTGKYGDRAEARAHGMSEYQLAKIREEQSQQRYLDKQRKTDMQTLDKQWEEHALNLDRQLVHQQFECNRRKKSGLIKNMRFNADLATEKRAQKEFNKDANVNEITSEFFEQFNKVTR
ncbi:RIB43A-like with coiled-coils protein 2 [Teleopsis dalmanni]|uniref:RIB43A-like with coiled-coils protein 2 n=1 Tax=Teleopsis dalmanni TaxID=139649 RepID=UPI0018CCFD83|nr:RIB43A-like with coiled-coils protein 2 [Teleopsis dalmanni]